MSTKRSTKVLVPLATLLAAGAIAVGSGASFTSTTGNTISAVTSGTLTQANSKEGQALFSVGNLKPGDVVNGKVTLTNTGSLPADFSLTEKNATNDFTGDNLTMVVKDVKDPAIASDDVVVHQGTFGQFRTAADLGTFAAKESRTYVFTVTFAADADNRDQGQTASATYAWDAVQLTGSTTDQ